MKIPHKPQRTRVHLLVTTRTKAWLREQSKVSGQPLGTIVDMLVERASNGTR